MRCFLENFSHLITIVLYDHRVTTKKFELEDFSFCDLNRPVSTAAWTSSFGKLHDFIGATLASPRLGETDSIKAAVPDMSHDQTV